MIKEDYVSFETAKLLKEKGFDDIDWECHGWIGRSGKHYFADDTFYDDKELKKAQEDRKDFIPLITLQMVMKWLREEHRIFLNVSYIPEHFAFTYRVISPLGETKFVTYVDTYEETCKVAIKYCLENLI